MTKNQKLLLFFCFLYLCIKIFSIQTTNFNLYGDEAQYWLWSKDLSFGYFSKPPFLPWLISFATFIFGDSFFVLKLIPLTLYCFSSFLVYLLSKKLWDDIELATITALTFFLLPAVSLSSFLLSTDVVLIFFWLLCLIQLLKTKDSPSYLNFIVLGCFVGLCLMAKYAAIYFVLSVVFLSIIEKEYRKLFLSLRSALAVLATLIVIFPNIIWNYKNNWITFSHVKENVSLGSIKLNFFNLVEFVSAQIIMIGPVLFLFFLIYCFKNTKLSGQDKFLISFFVPAFFIVMIESLLVRAHANWAAVSLVTASLFFVEKVSRYNKKVLYVNNYLNLFIGVGLFVMIAATYQTKSFDRISGLKNVVGFVDEKNVNNIKNFIVSDRLLFSNLNYYYRKGDFVFFTPHFPKTKIAHHFQLSRSLPVSFSENFILIGHKSDVGYLEKKHRIVKLGKIEAQFSKEIYGLYEVSFY